MSKTNYTQASTTLLIKNLPFLMFLAFLAAIYIANTHYAERKVREIQTLQKELKQERWRYMSLKSQLMYESKQIKVATRAKELGLRELEERPKKIVIKNNQR